MDNAIGAIVDYGVVRTAVVTGQPLSQLILANTSFTITSAVVGTPTPTVQWQLSVNDGATWSNIAGATSTTYTGGPLAVENSGYLYRAVFSNGAITAATTAATITVGTSIDGLIAGKTASTAQPLVSASDVSPAYPNTRNTGNWAASLDLSCMSLWNSENGGSKAGVLISPEHVLFAEHWKPTVGATLVFLSMTNERAVRTITQLTTAPGYSPYFPDYAVGRLNSPVPSSIGKAIFLADRTLFPTDSVANYPVMWKNQFNELCVSELTTFLTNSISYTKPTTGQRAAFGKTVITYDSGSPSFIVLDNKLVLLSVLTFGVGGSGTNLLSQRTNIDAIMTAQGGGYTTQSIVLQTPETP